jgi:hypothetical protein
MEVVVSTAKQAAPIVIPSSALAAAGNSANLIGIRGNTSKAIKTIFLTEAVSARGMQCQATPRRWTARQAPRAPSSVLLKLPGRNEVDRSNQKSVC